VNYLYISVALVFAMISATPAWSVSSVPDKPQTASISLGAEFASGKYGTDSTIRSVYMPLIAIWSPNDRFDFGIEIPFLYQSSSNVTTSLFSTSLSTAAAKSTLRGGPGGNRTTTQQPLAGTSTASGTTESDVSGLGDIIVRAGYILLAEKAPLPQLRLSLFVKTPTASESDGLGTGEFDYGGGFDLTKWYGDLHLTGEMLYIWQGKVNGFDLKNYVSYTAGVGYQLMESLEPMLLVKGATAPSGYSDSLLEARGRLLWSVSDTTLLDLYGSRGISDSSPEYGGGIAVIYSF
jgi:hypothetical protein